jgi:beta-glucosidase
LSPTVSAIVWSSYNAQREGEALADVLLGGYDPSGRLSATWFTSLGQLPEPITDYSIRPNGTNPGRTYMYYDGADGAVRYPFGYGLSYTTFAFSKLNIDRTRLNANDTLHVSADVTNSGDAAGTEVAQLTTKLNALSALSVRHPPGAPPATWDGAMFWLRRKTFCGS